MGPSSNDSAVRHIHAAAVGIVTAPGIRIKSSCHSTIRKLPDYWGFVLFCCCLVGRDCLAQNLPCSCLSLLGAVRTAMCCYIHYNVLFFNEQKKHSSGKIYGLQLSRWRMRHCPPRGTHTSWDGWKLGVSEAALLRSMSTHHRSHTCKLQSVVFPRAHRPVQSLSPQRKHIQFP